MATLCVLLTPRSAPAQADLWNRAYIKFDAGGVITSDTDVQDIFGPVDPGTRVKFDPGPRLGVDFGYHLTDWFAAELETGIMANSLKEITGADDVDATLMSVPVLLNVKLELPTRSPVTPYIGAGAGGSSSILSIDHLDYGGMHIEGTGSDFVFAWQAFGGVRIALNDRMGIGAEYRYFRSDGASFEGDEGDLSSIANDRIKFGGIESHVISLRFDVKF